MDCPRIAVGGRATGSAASATGYRWSHCRVMRTTSIRSNRYGATSNPLNLPTSVPTPSTRSLTLRRAASTASAATQHFVSLFSVTVVCAYDPPTQPAIPQNSFNPERGAIVALIAFEEIFGRVGEKIRRDDQSGVGSFGMRPREKALEFLRANALRVVLA